MHKATATIQGEDYIFTAGQEITDKEYSKLIDRHKFRTVKIEDKKAETPEPLADSTPIEVFLKDLKAMDDKAFWQFAQDFMGKKNVPKGVNREQLTKEIEKIKIAALEEKE